MSTPDPSTESLVLDLTKDDSEYAPQLLRRKALELIDDAIAHLRSTGEEPDVVVHEVRRRLKELRGITDLLRRALPNEGRQEWKLFRDAGRELATARDAKARVETIDRLRERFRDEWTPRQFIKIRRVLASRVTGEIDREITGRWEHALTTERLRLAAWPVDRMTRGDLEKAIGRSYRSSRRAMRRALDARTAESFHQWRKRVKVHWYHTRFLAESGFAPLDARARSMRSLSRTLGEHHDLVLIAATLEESPDDFGSRRYVTRFRSFLQRRMNELTAEAESSGKTLFAARTREWRVAELSEPPRAASRESH
ncbi:MAG: CHAD domain-containing protein [Thermoanaerobaculia bacterium]